MTTTTPRSLLLPLRHATTVALAIALVPACDSEATVDASELDSSFRDDHKTTGEKLNTNFLGDAEDYPLDNLPTAVGGEPNVAIPEIRASRCRDVSGMVLFGDFVSEAYPTITVTADGRLDPITVSEVGAPATTCTVDSDLWIDTFWEVEVVVDAVTTVATDLWLHDANTDAVHGYTSYEWYVNFHRIEDTEDRPQYRPTCDEDVTDAADPNLRYFAYLVPGMRVDGNGSFDVDPNADTVFIACRSGAVGKSISWGYAPWDHGTDAHELATRMVRADYCGDGISHTAAGTEIWVHSTLGPDPLAPAVAMYDREAIWNLADGHASCVDRPRLAVVPGATGFDCGAEGILPLCAASHEEDDDAIIITHSPAL